MAEATVLREFLVALGYRHDVASERRTVESMNMMTAKAVALGEIMKSTAEAVVAGVAKMASGLEDLYLTSLKTGSSAEKIQEFRYAMSRLGVSAGEATGTLLKFSDWLRSMPGAQGFVENLIGPFNGAEDAMEKLGKVFATMPSSMRNATADVMGISHGMASAMAGPFLEFEKQHADMAKAFGINADKMSVDGRNFMNQWSALEDLFSTNAQSFYSKIAAELTPVIAQFRVWLMQHGTDLNQFEDALIHGLGPVIMEVARLFEKTIDGVERLAKGWQDLSPGAKQAIEGIGIMAAALGVLATVLASPIALISTLAFGVAALIGYFDSWKISAADVSAYFEGSWLKSIIDTFDRATNSVRSFHDLLSGLWSLLTGVKDAALNIGSHLFGVRSAYGDTLHTEDVYQDPDKRSILRRGVDWWMGRPPPLSGEQQKANAKESSDFWLSKGLSAQAAAAMVGNERGESGLNPGAVGDNGQARGSFQWHPDRQAAIMAATGIDVANSKTSHADQLNAAYWEMTQSKDAGARTAWMKLLASQTTQDATAAVVGDYERPADVPGQIAMRKGYADQWLGSQNVVAAPVLANPAFAGAGGEGTPQQGAKTSNDNSSVTQTNTININGGVTQESLRHLENVLDRQSADALRLRKSAIQ